MKRENTVVKALNHVVTIDGKVIKEIYFDLKHINHGWNQSTRDYNTGPARQNYTEDDVIAFFEQLRFLEQKPTEQNITKNSIDKRYVFQIFEEDKTLKMVIDLMKDSSTIVVTIY